MLLNRKVKVHLATYCLILCVVANAVLLRCCNADAISVMFRSPSCIAVRAHKAVMLFDCGEDAQRQLLKQPQIVHGKVNRIFVTDLSSTSIYGIPGELYNKANCMSSCS